MVTEIPARFVSPIYRFLYTRLGNQEEAERLTSAVFLRAVQELDPGQDEASIRAWLYQAARMTLADYWRQRHGLLGDPLAESERAEPDPTGSPDQRAADLARWLLDQLPDPDRELVRLRFVHNYLIQEAAQALGITVNEAMILQYRALQRVAQLRREHERREQ